MGLMHDVLSLIAAHPDLKSEEMWEVVHSYREQENEIFSNPNSDRSRYNELLKSTANKVYLGNIADRRRVQLLLNELHGMLERRQIIQQLGLDVGHSVRAGNIVRFSSDYRVQVQKPNGRKVYLNPITIQMERREGRV